MSFIINPHRFATVGGGGDPSTMLAMTQVSSPWVRIYTVSGTSFTLLPNPATLPPARALDLSFSPDKTKLAVGHDDSPFMTVYNISGTTFTKMANPSSLPSGDGESVHFSPAGTYLVQGNNGDPQESVYTYNPTLVNVDDTGSYAGTVTKMRYNPAGTLLTITDDSLADQRVRIFSSSSGILTRVAGQPATQPSQVCATISWNPTGTLCFIGGGSTGFNTSFNLYSVSGTTFTKQSNPATVPGSTTAITGAAFNPAGTLLAVTASASPYVYLYTVSGSTLTYVSPPAVLPAAGRSSCSFSRDGSLLALGGNAGVNIFTVSGTTLTYLTNLEPQASSSFSDVEFN
jgi:hypothetical protein